MSHPLLIDRGGESFGWKISAPDFPGCAAWGGTLPEAFARAALAVRERMELLPAQGAIPAPSLPERLELPRECAHVLLGRLVPGISGLPRADALDLLYPCEALPTPGGFVVVCGKLFLSVLGATVSEASAGMGAVVSDRLARAVRAGDAMRRHLPDAPQAGLGDPRRIFVPVRADAIVIAAVGAAVDAQFVTGGAAAQTRGGCVVSKDDVDARADLWWDGILWGGSSA